MAEHYPALDADPNVRAQYFSQQLNKAREDYNNLKREKLNMEVEFHNSIDQVGKQRDAAEQLVQKFYSEKDEVERRQRDIQEREARINELRAKLEAMLKKKVCSHGLLIHVIFSLNMPIYCLAGELQGRLGARRFDDGGLCFVWPQRGGPEGRLEPRCSFRRFTQSWRSCCTRRSRRSRAYSALSIALTRKAIQLPIQMAENFYIILKVLM